MKSEIYILDYNGGNVKERLDRAVRKMGERGFELTTSFVVQDGGNVNLHLIFIKK